MAKKLIPGVDRVGWTISRVNAAITRIAKLLGTVALNNVVALVALGVAVVSLRVSLVERREARYREMLATTMTSDFAGEAHASIEFLPNILSPFDPPYLMLPIRLFVMNRSSIPLTVIGLWVTFDEGPEDQLRYVILEHVRETNGLELAWPKTVPPKETAGFDVTIPISITSDLVSALRASPDNPETRDLGPASRLWFTIGERNTQCKDAYQRLRRQVRFDFRLLSASPGAPTHLPYSVLLP